MNRLDVVDERGQLVAQFDLLRRACAGCSSSGSLLLSAPETKHTLHTLGLGRTTRRGWSKRTTGLSPFLLVSLLFLVSLFFLFSLLLFLSFLFLFSLCGASFTRGSSSLFTFLGLSFFLLLWLLSIASFFWFLSLSLFRLWLPIFLRLVFFFWLLGRGRRCFWLFWFLSFFSLLLCSRFSLFFVFRLHSMTVHTHVKKRTVYCATSSNLYRQNYRSCIYNT